MGELKTAAVCCRLSKEDEKILLQVCRARGESVGNFIRPIILKRLAELGCFSEDRRKILLATV